MKKLIEKLKRLLAKLLGKEEQKPAPVAPPTPVAPPVVVPVAPPPALTPVAPEPVALYPRIEKIRGLNIKLNAPVNPLWEPSMEGFVFGNLPGTFVGDPSNAPPGYPNRTPAGFPIAYGGVHWDTVKGEWAGTPLPEWGIPFAGVVLFPKGRTDEQTVRDHLTAVGVRDENSKENDRITASTRWLGPINAASLSQNDLAWLYAKSTEFRDVQAANGRIQNGDLHRTVLNGMHGDIARAINGGESHHRNYHDPSSLGVPENKELERVVEGAIESARAGNVPPQSSSTVV